MFGIDPKTRVNHETQRGIVLEGNNQARELPCREELDEVHDLALYLVEAIEAPALGAADEGLSASTCQRVKNVRDILDCAGRGLMRLAFWETDGLWRGNFCCG